MLLRCCCSHCWGVSRMVRGSWAWCKLSMLVETCACGTNSSCLPQLVPGQVQFYIFTGPARTSTRPTATLHLQRNTRIGTKCSTSQLAASHLASHLAASSWAVSVRWWTWSTTATDLDWSTGAHLLLLEWQLHFQHMWWSLMLLLWCTCWKTPVLASDMSSFVAHTIKVTLFSIACQTTTIFLGLSVLWNTALQCLFRPHCQDFIKWTCVLNAPMSSDGKKLQFQKQNFSICCTQWDFEMNPLILHPECEKCGCCSSP